MLNSTTDNIPSINDDLTTWLSYLETIHTQSIDMGLQRSYDVAQRLDLLKPAPMIITVGGTNGKGTTCRALELFLLEAGYSVGVYSSPHLLKYNERVRINGNELSDSYHVTAFDFLEKNRGNTSLTYFEFGTLSALYLFKEAKLDVVILEVGLGGRLDSCNIVDADIAVITSIDIDHIDWLGNDRAQIAKEKAGIFRANNSAVIGEPLIPETLVEVAQNLGTLLFEVGQSWHYTEESTSWSWHGPDFSLTHLSYPKIPLANAATAIATLYISGYLNGGKERITPVMIESVLRKVSMPGRFQIVKTQTITTHPAPIQSNEEQVLEVPYVILDVAHNPHAARYLSQQINKLKTEIKQYVPHAKTHFIIGMLEDKDIQSTIFEFKDVADHWHFVSLNGPRGADANCLIQALNALPDCHTKQDSFTYQTMSDALSVLETSAGKGDIIVICGSFYTVAEYLKLVPSVE